MAARLARPSVNSTATLNPNGLGIPLRTDMDPPPHINVLSEFSIYSTWTVARVFMRSGVDINYTARKRSSLVITNKQAAGSRQNVHVAPPPSYPRLLSCDACFIMTITRQILHLCNDRCRVDLSWLANCYCSTWNSKDRSPCPRGTAFALLS